MQLVYIYFNKVKSFIVLLETCRTITIHCCTETKIATRQSGGAGCCALMENRAGDHDCLRSRWFYIQRVVSRGKVTSGRTDALLIKMPTRISVKCDKIILPALVWLRFNIILWWKMRQVSVIVLKKVKHEGHFFQALSSPFTFSYVTDVCVYVCMCFCRYIYIYLKISF